MGLYKQALQCKRAAAVKDGASGGMSDMLNKLYTELPYMVGKVSERAGEHSAKGALQGLDSFSGREALRGVVENIAGTLHDEARLRRKLEAKELSLSALAGGGAAAGTYGLTGLVPGLRDSRLLRWLLAGTAGAAAGLGTYAKLDNNV